MKEEFEAEVLDNSHSGWNGWVDETIVSPLETRLFDEILEPFIGKKVKITIEEIE